MKKIKKLLMVVLATTLLLALGITASADDGATITIKNATINQEYKGYKIFDASGTAPKISYTIEKDSKWYEAVTGAKKEENALFVLTAIDTDTFGVKLNGDIEENDIIAWLEKLSVPEDATPELTAQSATTNSLQWENVNPGYYYITSALGSLVTVDNATTNITIIDKNQTPNWDPETPEKPDNPGTPDKPGKPDGGTATGKFVSNDGTLFVKENTASIQDTLHFKINAYTPKYNRTKLVSDYTFTDTFPEEIDIIENTLVVTINGTKVYPLAPDDEKVSVQYESRVLTIKYSTNDVMVDYPVEAHVSITYDAILNDGAKDVNTNEVDMIWREYDPDKGDPDNPDNPSAGDVPGTSSTDTKTYGFFLNKINSDEELLDGAEFELYTSATGETKIGVIYDEEYYRPVADGETAEVIVAGTAKIWGLAEGTYYLEETKAPDGYNQLTSRTPAIILNDETTTSGVKTATVNVINNAGTALPSTGGIGTTIFYVVGGVLMLGAVVLLVTKKRMNSKR